MGVWIPKAAKTILTPPKASIPYLIFSSKVISAASSESGFKHYAYA